MARHEIRLILAGFLLALLSSFGQTFFIALFSGEIRAGLDLSHGEFGSVYSAATLASGLTMLWAGAALDHFSLRRYALVAIGTLALAGTLLALSHNVLLLLLALFGLRLAGQGMMSHAAVTGMARAFTRHRGKAVALASLGHPAGEAFLPVVAVAAAAALGWRNVWLVAVAVLVLIAPLLARLLEQAADGTGRGALNTPSEPTTRSYTRAEMLRERRFYLMVPALIGPSFIVTGLFFHQVHLSAAKGWDLAWFAACFAGYAAASTGAVMVSGALIDRLGARRLMPVYLLPLALGCIVLALGQHHLVALAFMALAGLTSGAAITVVTAMWAEVYGTAHLGAIRALAATLSVVASALAPASLGWLIDAAVSIEIIAAASAIYLLAATVAVGSVFVRLDRFRLHPD